MTATPSTTAPRALESAPAGERPPPRRKREELEALAADFVNSKLHQLPPPRKPVPKAVLAAVGAVLLAVLAWMLWPAGDTPELREATAAAADHEAWVRRLEADRERKRQELQRSREYLAKMAAADSALLADMSARAPRLAARTEAPQCAIHVSDLSSSGKLTYADVARMEGSRTDAQGHVFTPPVKVEGRDLVFEVMPNGCARIARSAMR